MTQGDTVIGYVRVSTDEQGISGASLESQRNAIEAECTRKGWRLLRIEQDVRSGKTLERPGVRAALEACNAGEARGIVAAKLDRLSRSVADFSALLNEARGRFDVVVLDAGVDTTTPHGKAMVQMVSVFAELERELIGQRTKDALAIKRAQGVKLGRPSNINPVVAERIRKMRESGLSLQAICDRLNAQNIPTPGGGKEWRPTSLRAVLR